VSVYLCHTPAKGGSAKCLVATIMTEACYLGPLVLVQRECAE
jgi:hypothetical protein